MKIAFLATTLVGLLAFSSLATTKRVEKANNPIFLPTTHRVETGIDEYVIRIVRVNPCGVIQAPENANISLKAYSILYEKCQDTYKAEWLTAFHGMVNCYKNVAQEANSKIKQNTDDAQSDHTIRKRFIIPALAAAFVVIVGVVVIAALVVTAVHYIDPWRVREKLDLASTLQQQQELELSAVKGALNVSSDVSQKTLDVASTLSHKIEQNRQNLLEFTATVGDIAWLATKLYVRISSQASDMRKIAETCTTGHLATSEVMKVFNVSRLDKVDPSDTRIEAIQLINDATLEIRFSATKTSRDTNVFRVEPFQVYSNFTKRTPDIKTYNGPKYAIYNSSSNCMLGITDPSQTGVYEECPMRDFYDSSLNSWVITKSVEAKLKPQVKKSSAASYVYCMFDEITTTKGTQPCEPYVMRIPIKEQFSTPGHEHSITTHQLHAKDEQIIWQAVKLSSADPSEEFRSELEYINEVRKLTEEQFHLKQQASRPPTLSAALAPHVSSFWNFIYEYGGYISIVITILGLLWRSQGNGGVTVIEPPAQAPAQPSVLIMPEKPSTGCPMHDAAV